MTLWKYLVIILTSIVLSALLISCGNEATKDKDVEEPAEQVAEDEGKETTEGKIAYVDAFDIWVANSDGSGRLNLTNSAQKEYAPRISPDGSKIAFTRENGNRNVYVVNSDGTELKRLTQGTPGDDFAPAWSPDGSSIAFISTRDHTEVVMPIAEVYLMSPDGSNQKRLSYTQYGLENPGALWWLPDGSKIAIWGMGTGAGTGIGLLDPTTGEEVRPERLYGILEEYGYLAKVINNYAVNPDYGNLVACTLGDLESKPGDREKQGLFIIDLDKGLLNKVDELMLPISCAWSLDGEYLYFTNRVDEGRYGFFVVEKDGGEKQALSWLPQVPPHDDFYFCTYADFYIGSSIDTGK